MTHEAPESAPTTVGPADALAPPMAAARPEASDPVLARALAHLRVAVGATTTIDRYRILGRVGSGGFGHVFRAEDPLLSRTVAIKVPRPGRGIDDRFAQEAQMLAQLDHPGVVRIFDVGRQDHHSGSGFIVMEFVDGETLATWCRGRTPEAIFTVFAAIAGALRAAHAVGILHRDVKPANILVDASGAAKLADFGIARPVGDTRATAHTGEAGDQGEPSTDPHPTGTPHYMAPEQRAGRPFDERADIYAFSLTLYETLFGGRLVRDPSNRPMLPDTPDIPDAIARALEHGLASDPARRMRSMDAWVAALAVPRRHRRVRVGLALVAAMLGVAVMGETAPAEVADEPAALVHSSIPAADFSAIEDALDRLALDEARAGLAPVLAQAEDDRAMARALLRRARIERAAGFDTDADATLRRVIDLAEAADDGACAAEALLVMAIAAGMSRRDFAAADDYLRRAASTVERIGAPCELDVELRVRRGDLERASGRAGESVATLAEVEVLAASCGALSDEAQAMLQRSYAWALLDAGDAAAAEARLRALVTRTEVRHGTESPRLVPTLANLALVRVGSGALADAEALSRRAIAIAEHHHLDRGVIDPSIGTLGLILSQRGDAASSMALLDEVLQRRIERGAHPIRIAQSRVRVGMHALEAGDPERGLREALAASITFEAINGPRHFDVAVARSTVAVAYSRMGDERRAAVEFRRILDEFAESLSPRHPLMLNVMANLARTELRLGEVAAAQVLLTALRRELEAAGLTQQLAPLVDSIASAVAFERGDRAEATRLAQAAVDGYGDERSHDADASRAWLDHMASDRSAASIRALRAQLGAEFEAPSR